MSLFLKWFLRYRYPRYQRAYRMVFDPEGYHHYPKELQTQLQGSTKESVYDALRKNLSHYMKGKEEVVQRTLERIADVTLELPRLLEATIALANSKSLSSRHKKDMIAVVAYLVSPVDILPEGTASVSGFADDVLFAAVAYHKVAAEGAGKVLLAEAGNESAILNSLEELNALAPESMPELFKEVTSAFQRVFA